MLRKPDTGSLLTRNKHFTKCLPSVLLLFMALLFCVPYLSFPNPQLLEFPNLAEEGLDELSSEFQGMIRKTQEQGCKCLTLHCGHFNRNESWPYAEPWDEVFYPLGSNCSVNNSTLNWDWRIDKRDKRIKFDLLKGLPILKSVHDRLKFLHSEPFLWVVGQFMKYALRPSKDSEMKLEKWSEKIELSDWTNETTVEKIVGFQVRRTDKIKEVKDSYHELPEYVGKAESYFSKMEENSSSRLPRRVLFFSDDNKALYDAKNTYPWWDIRGFNSTIDHTSYLQPKKGTASVMEIFRDIFLLSECDYVICGYSSNLCRLLLEIMSFKHNEDPRGRIASLDGSYTYLCRTLFIQ